jgi:5-formyltetrahydrofolate cyclo-ligase
VTEKHKLRAKLRAARRAYVDDLPQTVRRLILSRPPAPVARLTEGAAMIGLYHASAHEAPTLSYAKWFHERGQGIALPWFADRGAAMGFRQWLDPYDSESHDGAALEPGPWGALQPRSDAPEVVPEVVFVPLLGFTQDGHRLGQGGGHYDRWLAAHPEALALGLGWDCQLLDDLPLEPHDCGLRAVISPTRIYGDIA